MKPTQIRLGTNRPFFLERNSAFWVVASGEVDVYFVKRDAQGAFQSARTFLYTARKGDILFSLKTDQDTNEFTLLAVSADSKLIEVHKSFIGNLDKSQLTHKLERWVQSLAQYTHQENRPKVYRDLAEKTSIELRRGEIGYPSRGMRWANLQEGTVAIFGEPDVLETVASTKNIYLPITKDLRVQATKTARMELLDTRAVVEDDINLMLSIHRTQAYFFEKIKASYLDAKEKEAVYLHKRIAADESALETGLSGLGSIVRRKDRTRSFLRTKTSNPLFAACQIIGQKSGFEFSEPKFIRDYEHNTSGQLNAIAQVSDVRIRKVILRGEWWKSENGHLLAFTQEGNEPVALIQHSSNEYELHNPRTQTVQQVTQEVAVTLEPIAYMFLYAFDEPITSIKKLWKFAVKGLQLDGTYIILAALAGSLIGLLTPVLSGILFDDVIPQADRSFLLEIFCILFVIGIVKALLDLVKGLLLLRVETKSNITVQAGLMDHLLRLPVTFYRRFSAGDLTMRALGVNTIRQIISNTVLTTILSGTFSVVNIILLFYYSPRLAWVGIGLALLAIIIVSTLGLLKLRFDRKISDEQGELQGFLFEFLSGISKIRVSGSENRIFGLWANKFASFKTLGFKSGNYQNFVETFKGSYPLLTNIFFFSFIYVAFQNASSTSADLISVGVFIAFIAAFNQFLGDCLNMSMGLISSLNVIPIYERLKPILEETPESSSGDGDPGELSGEIEFNSVSFRYAEDQPLVLKEVSFKINPGEMVAFVGPSGSGKSTVLRLLLGFEEAELGSIYYDGQAFDSLNKELVRRQMGVVLQNGSLMGGSIFNNIVGDSELTLKDAEEAAELAGLSKDIEQMPMGMHTVVGGGGNTFSGGQRQRLMIARAIVHKPRILFMDEATSALDNRTQDIVSESLDRLQATRIVIAHRLSTIVNADRIYVLDQGRIVESGTYEELLAQDGLFSTLAKRQIA